MPQINLHNCCCMEYMKTIPDKYFNLSICDPPYGLGFSSYERGASGIKTKQRFTKTGKKDWDSGVPDNEYFIELQRVSKNQIIWGGNYFLPLAKIESPNLKKIEDFNKYIENSSEKWLFWYKQNPVPNFADGELAWLSKNLQSAQFNYRYYGNIEGNTSASEKYHPTQKPVKLYEWLLRNYAKQGDKILDTHGGSFSHAIAAHNLGFDLDICEIDAEYYEKGVNRLKIYQSQVSMF